MKVLIQITHEGRTQTAKEWAAELGVPVRRIYERIQAGWTPEAALSRSVMIGRLHDRTYNGYRWRLENLRRHDTWNAPLERDPWALAAIDVAAEEGGFTLQEVGHLMGGICRERVRQIEEAAMRKIRASGYREVVEMLRDIDAARTK